MGFAELEIFIKEVLCGFSLVRREGVDFSNLRDKEFIKVYFMIIENRGEFIIFRGRVTLGLAFSAAMASSVVVVSLTTRGKPAGINQELQYMIWWMF